MRQDRKSDSLRQLKATTDFVMHPHGSVLIEFGNTKVICTAFVEDKVPAHCKGTGRGWVSAEYSMLPGSTHTRKQRDSSRGKVDGRSQEIQRLIGRSLRGAVDLTKLEEKTIWIDCDVIQADGGTRTAAITGGFIALSLATRKLLKEGIIAQDPIITKIAAVSVGIVDGEEVLDLDYLEDSNAQADMNFVMNDRNEFIEVQGTGETAGFTFDQLSKLAKLAEKGINELFDFQKQHLGE